MSAIPGPAGTRAEPLRHPQPSSRPSLTRVAEAEEGWGGGERGAPISISATPFFFFLQGQSRFILPSTKSGLHFPLHFVFHTKSPAAIRSVSVRGGGMQASPFPGAAVPGHEQYPRPGFPQAHRGLSGCKVLERGGGQTEGVNTPFSAGEVPPGIADPAVSLGSGRMPCLPYHLGFKCLSHTLGVAAKHCAFCTSLHLDFEPLQLVFGSGFQAFSSPISYPHWFPL